MGYDFSTLNDKEFEMLALDILNAKFSLDLQGFKNGKDQGRDLRYSTTINPDSIVVQAKHYAKSTYKVFIRDLKKEKRKVILLAPDRYIIVTSQSLSAKNKDEIFNMFKPFLLSPNDVFGVEDLNKYLSRLPDIEVKWYKLWLSSVPILKNILNNAVTGRSAFFEAKIKRTVQLYVHSKSYNDAFEILKTNKYILITGQPGVGKTTLAHLLTYNLLSHKYKLIYIDSDVKDAEDVFSPDPRAKQIVFFDDFLGANYLEIINPKTSESKFVSFLERVKTVPNKFLILTTRTTIFRNAIDKYEKLRRVKIDMARKEIELGQYSDLDKAKILYNHIYHSKLPSEKKAEILDSKGYWKIIKHRNYNPRLIEFITDPVNSTSEARGKYMEFILKNLENPEQVWRHAYEQQLTLEEKLLLHSVFSQKPNANANDTKRIFDAFLKYEVECLNYRPISNPYNNASRKLLDGILKKEIILSSKAERVSFINPSINDFLISYFNENGEERWKIIKASVYIEQFEQYAEYFFEYFSTKLVNIAEETSKYARHVLQNITTIGSLSLSPEEIGDGVLLLRIASFLMSLAAIDAETEAKVDELALEAVGRISIDKLEGKAKRYFMSAIKLGSSGKLLKEYVKTNWNKIIIALFDSARDEEDFDEVKNLFDEYENRYEDFMKERSNYEFVKEQLSVYVDDQTKDWFSDEKNSIISESDWDRIKYELESKRRDIFSKFDIYDDVFDADDLLKWENIEDLIEENIAYKREDQSGAISNAQAANGSQSDEFEEEIEKLFVGEYDPEAMAAVRDDKEPPF